MHKPFYPPCNHLLSNLSTYIPDQLSINWVNKVKPDVNSVEVHPRLMGCNERGNEKVFSVHITSILMVPWWVLDHLSYYLIDAYVRAGN
jgi:hypothetical protein